MSNDIQKHDENTEIQLQPTSSARGLAIGLAFAVALFFVMALAQMMGTTEPTTSELTEDVIAFVPPDIDIVEEDEPPPPENEEPPPELEKEPPALSLAQLDIALNPGTGGSLMGDFAMPTFGSDARALGTDEFVDFSDLDQMPRPIGVSGFEFPRRLLKKKVNGKVVLLVKLDENGEVVEVDVESSSLPDFDDFIQGEVERWTFTAPTRQGRPVKAMARLPIPINIS